MERGKGRIRKRGWKGSTGSRAPGPFFPLDAGLGLGGLENGVRDDILVLRAWNLPEDGEIGVSAFHAR